MRIRFFRRQTVACPFDLGTEINAGASSESEKIQNHLVTAENPEKFSILYAYLNYLLSIGNEQIIVPRETVLFRFRFAADIYSEGRCEFEHTIIFVFFTEKSGFFAMPGICLIQPQFLKSLST